MESLVEVLVGLKEEEMLAAKVEEGALAAGEE